MIRNTKKVTQYLRFATKHKFPYVVILTGWFVVSAFNSNPTSTSSPIPTADTTIATVDTAATPLEPQLILSEKLINYALSLKGTPYRYGGKSESGFDCSGFIYHVFGKFDIQLNRSSRTQSAQGSNIPIEELRKGDLLFFTGTNVKQRTVGHVGMVISEPGEEVQFIHSSSYGGVKISTLEGYYTTRFLFAKRMIEE